MQENHLEEKERRIAQIERRLMFLGNRNLLEQHELKKELRALYLQKREILEAKRNFNAQVKR